MQARKMKKVAALAVLVVASLAPVGGTANAEDLTGDWSVVAIAQDPCGKNNPLRNGYYNWGTGGGWGYQKIALKHGLPNVIVWRDTMRMTCGAPDVPGSTTWIYRSTAKLEYCSGGNCETLDKTVLRAVIQRAQFNGERKGTITLYCEGVTVCPAWVNDYTNLRMSARQGVSVNIGDEEGAGATTEVSLESAPQPAALESANVPEVAVPTKLNGSRGARVLHLLQGDLRKLTFGLTPTIKEFRQADANTVEIIYSYPGYDGLIGLRRNVSARAVDTSPADNNYLLAINENSPREIATMLRVDLEEPPLVQSLKPAEDGISWWGSPASRLAP